MLSQGVARVLACLSFILGGTLELWAADSEKGRKLSEQHCSRCHVVGDFNPTGGISSTPSFQMMVNNMSDYQDRFRTFYARLPHPSIITVEGIERPTKLPYNAAPIFLKPVEVEHISAFAETLKKTKETP